MRAWLRLSLVFSIAGLLASRIGLLVHEFVGHGGMAYALGGTVPNWRLFLFGGGWIQYKRNPWYSSGQEITIALAGCGSELIFASLVYLVSTRLAGVPRAIARIAAMLLCAHTCVYIATGTHYGYGDGMKLHGVLSPLLRHVLVLGLSFTMAALAYALAKQALLLAALLELGSGFKRIALAGAAAMVACLVHGSLTYGERLIIDPDQTYEAMMQREVERRAATYAAQLAKQERGAGQTFTVQQEASAKEAYVEKHEPWPLRPLLVLLGALASALACWRFRLTESQKLIGWRMTTIRGPSIALALTILAIVVIDALG
jgi:hypothetical protein